MSLNFKYIKIKFGKYKGKQYYQIPNDYLKWGLDNKVFKGKLKQYALKKLNYPKFRFRVKVENAVDTDNISYIVKAHHKNEAIREVEKQFGVKSSQSGTTYTVIQLN